MYYSLRGAWAAVDLSGRQLPALCAMCAIVGRPHPSHVQRMWKAAPFTCVQRLWKAAPFLLQAAGVEGRTLQVCAAGVVLRMGREYSSTNEECVCCDGLKIASLIIKNKLKAY